MVTYSPSHHLLCNCMLTTLSDCFSPEKCLFYRSYTKQQTNIFKSKLQTKPWARDPKKGILSCASRWVRISMLARSSHSTFVAPMTCMITIKFFSVIIWWPLEKASISSGAHVEACASQLKELRAEQLHRSWYTMHQNQKCKRLHFKQRVQKSQKGGYPTPCAVVACWLQISTSQHLAPTVYSSPPIPSPPDSIHIYNFISTKWWQIFDLTCIKMYAVDPKNFVALCTSHKLSKSSP